MRSYGRRQLDSILRDRPALQAAILPGSAIESWLIAAFNAPELPYRIAWTNQPTTPDVDTVAQSDPFPQYDDCSYIRVDAAWQHGPRAGQPHSIDEMMAGLVFELNNVRHSGKSAVLDQQAAFGTLGRREYIIACAREEYEAFHKTAEFYQNLWLPFCRSDNRSTDFSVWHVREAAGTFDQFLAQYPPDFWYPWKFYSTRYEWDAKECGPAAFQKAQAGDASAQYRVGYVYFYTDDFPDALIYFLRSARQGNVDAEMVLAWQYAYAKGTMLDEPEAFAWYLKAAEAGNGKAMSEVARRYTLGLGVAPNAGEAKRWFLSR